MAPSFDHYFATFFQLIAKPVCYRPPFIYFLRVFIQIFVLFFCIHVTAALALIQFFSRTTFPRFCLSIIIQSAYRAHICSIFIFLYFNFFVIGIKLIKPILAPAFITFFHKIVTYIFFGERSIVTA